MWLVRKLLYFALITVHFTKFLTGNFCEACCFISVLRAQEFRYITVSQMANFEMNLGILHWTLWEGGVVISRLLLVVDWKWVPSLCKERQFKVLFHENWKLVRMELRFPNKPLPKLLIFSFVEGISMTKMKKYHFVGMCWMMWIIMNCCKTTNPSIYGCEIQNKCLLENLSLPASITCNVKQDLGLYSFKKFSIVPQESLTLESENKLFQYLAACMDNTFLWWVFSVYSHSLA